MEMENTILQMAILIKVNSTLVWEKDREFTTGLIRATIKASGKM